MIEYINVASLEARNERILLQNMLNIWEYIQGNFNELTANWIPCLGSFYIRALMIIVISTNAQVLTIQLTYTSLTLGYVSVFFRPFSGGLTSNKHIKTHELLSYYLGLLIFLWFVCCLLCKTTRSWCEGDRKFALLVHYMWKFTLDICAVVMFNYKNWSLMLLRLLKIMVKYSSVYVYENIKSISAM